MRELALGLGRERLVLVCVWGLAAVACLMGLVLPAPQGAHPGVAEQALDLVRVVASTGLAIVLVLGPGLVLRIAPRRRHIELGFVPLPGIALLVAVAAVAWAASGAGISPRAVCFVALTPVLAWLLAGVIRAEPAELFAPEERGALLIVAAAMGLAIGRSLWSLGVSGELLGGTNFRTLEVGDRSDSRLPFGVVQLVSYGTSPFSALARSYFGGYSFSDRGPLAGLASAPVVLLTHGRPPVHGTAPWSPFDPQGFMTYRLTMMTLGCTAFLSLWTLARRLGGVRMARFALLLAATTPFLVHEIWFTWPKLLAASLVLLSALMLISGRPFVAGLLSGVGYLAHPLALLSLPALALLALWPLAGARFRHPQLRQLLLLVAGVAIWLVAWRVANWSHYSQSAFLKYLGESGKTDAVRADIIRALGGHPGPVQLSAWISDRLRSLANTLVPLRLFVFGAHDQWINSALQRCFPFCTGGSPPIVHFFFQYWTGVPFGFAIVFFPLLLQGLWRAARRWPWPFAATVIVPFLVFAIYWGDADTGLMREGLHVWVLTVIVFLALEQRCERFAWLRAPLPRALLVLRTVEVLLVAMLPTLVTRHRLYQSRFALTDTIAVLAMLTSTVALGILVWRERAGAAGPPPPRAGPVPPQRPRRSPTQSRLPS